MLILGEEVLATGEPVVKTGCDKARRHRSVALLPHSTKRLTVVRGLRLSGVNKNWLCRAIQANETLMEILHSPLRENDDDNPTT